MSTAERHQGERQPSEASRGAGAPSRSTTSAGPVAGSLLSLQRQAGNRAATLVVQPKVAAILDRVTGKWVDVSYLVRSP